MTTPDGQKGRALSPVSRVLSGSVGSIVYCLAFTPLEVVKTRQQAAGPNVASPASSPHSSPSGLKAFHRGRGAVMLCNGLRLPEHAFPALVAPQYRASHPTGICARFFESATHLILKPHHYEKPSGGILDTLVSISRNEGRRGLYKGLSPTLLAAVPNTAIYFTAYDDITLLLRQHHARNGTTNEDAKQKVCVPLIAGATARLMSSVATAPLELIRTRQASTVGSSSGVIDEFRYLLRKNGPFALYRGLGPMILRDVPFSALYFLSLETAKELLSSSSHLGAWGARFYNERGMATPTSVEVVQAFLSGATAGAIATLATTPFDVIKTRRQMVQQGEQKQGTLCSVRQLVRTEGFFKGLWKGNNTRLIKVAPGYAVMMSCIEFSKILLEDGGVL